MPKGLFAFILKYCCEILILHKRLGFFFYKENNFPVRVYFLIFKRHIELFCVGNEMRNQF